MISDNYYQDPSGPQPHQQQQPQPQPQIIPQFMSPEVLKMASVMTNAYLPDEIKNLDPKQLEQRIAQSQALIPSYFAVTPNSIIHRIKNLACPFFVKQWSRSVPEGQQCIPINNPNAPELYTPITFCFLFFLLSALISGVQNKFSMDYLYLQIIKFGLIIFVEVAICKTLFKNVGVQGSYPILSLIADFSCLSFYMCVVTLFSWNCALYWISFLYCAFSAMIWTLRTLNSEQCMAGRQSSSTVITYVLLFFALAQIALLFFLAPTIYNIGTKVAAPAPAATPVPVQTELVVE